MLAPRSRWRQYFANRKDSILRNKSSLGRVRAQDTKLGRPKVSAKIEAAILAHLRVGNGILKVASIVGVGSGTVQRVRKEFAMRLADAA
jgi:hypothetical protein